MTKTYEQHGLYFQHPDDWTVTEDSVEGWPKAVTIDSPGSSYVSIYVYPPPSDPADFVDEVLAAMREEYEELEFHPLERTVEKSKLRGYRMHFYHHNLLVTSQVLGFPKGVLTLIVICQGEDREFSRTEPHFKAILASILRDTPGAKVEEEMA